MNRKGELSHEEWLQLRSLQAVAGYQVLLAIMEREVQNAERDLVEADPLEKELVLECHRRARHVREYVERLKTIVSFELAEGMERGTLAAPSGMEDELAAVPRWPE